MYDVFPLDNHNCILLFRRLSILANKIKENANVGGKYATVKFQDYEVYAYQDANYTEKKISFTIGKLTETDNEPLCESRYYIQITKDEKEYEIVYQSFKDSTVNQFIELLNKIEKLAEYHLGLYNQKKEKEEKDFKADINRILTTCI